MTDESQGCQVSEAVIGGPDTRSMVPFVAVLALYHGQVGVVLRAGGRATGAVRKNHASARDAAGRIPGVPLPSPGPGMHRQAGREGTHLRPNSAPAPKECRSSQGAPHHAINTLPRTGSWQVQYTGTVSGRNCSLEGWREGRGARMGFPGTCATRKASHRRHARRGACRTLLQRRPPRHSASFHAPLSRSRASLPHLVGVTCEECRGGCHAGEAFDLSPLDLLKERFCNGGSWRAGRRRRRRGIPLVQFGRRRSPTPLPSWSGAPIVEQSGLSPGTALLIRASQPLLPAMTGGFCSGAGSQPTGPRSSPCTPRGCKSGTCSARSRIL